MPFKPNHPPANENGADACALFKPLFSADDCGKDSAGNDSKDPAVLLEEACQEGMQKGLKSGCEEAWSIARTTIRPSLRAFIHAIESLCALNEQIQDKVSQNTLSLALTIVRQILGDNVSLSLMDVSGLKDDFGEALAATNRFVFNLHPDDAADLKEFIAAEEMNWPAHPTIDIKLNPSLQPGAILVEAPASREPLTAKVKEGLSALLSRLG